MATDPTDRTITRSPGYPYIDLGEAIDKTRAISPFLKRGAASPEVIASHWGYAEKSSGGRMCASALKKFGLLEEIGSGSSRQLRLTKLAQTILLAEGPEHRGEWLEAIREAALSPEVHKDLWDQWGPDLPSDSSIRLYLVRERDFNEGAAKDLIKEYKKTLAFARLDDENALANSDRSSTLGGVLDDDAAPDYRRAATAPVVPVTAMTHAQPPAVSQPADFALAAAPARVLSIPLDDGRSFDVRFPLDLSKEDFDFVMENIRLWERKIVAKAKADRPTSPAEE